MSSAAPATSEAAPGPASGAPAPAPAAAAPSTVDQIKHPVPWLNWGADLRVRHEYLPNPFLIDRDPPGHDWNSDRFRMRLWGTVTPADPLDLNVRLTTEPRYWWDPPSKGDWDPGDIIWDNLNFKLRLGQPSDPVPSTLTVGRQDLRYGDGWLIFEGTPLDGSRSIYFDAARLALDFKQAKTTTDLVFIQQFSDSDAWLRPFSDEDRAQIEQDERGAIVYVSNKSVANTQIDGYFIYKHDERVLANGDQGEVYTVGSRVVHDFSEHWQGKVEGAYQFGRRNNPAIFPTSNGDLSAWGLNSKLTYRFKDTWNNQIYAGYEYLSGDDPKTSGNEEFDPLWARWPQWSELYVYTYAVETRIAETSNLHRLGVGWQMEPVKSLNLSLTYNALFADTNPRGGQAGFSTDGKFRGHLFTGTIQYKFDRYLSGNLVGEYLLPGNYYQDAPGALDSRRDPAAYLRAEIVLTF